MSLLSAPVRCTLLVVFVSLAATSAASQPPMPAPTLDVVLQRAGAYATAYAEQFSSVVAEERSDQSTDSGPRGFVTTRLILSDILLVRLPGTAQWMGFRDVFEVNRSKVRDREDRLLKLFVESPSTAVVQARRLADESARFNVGDLTRNFNLPTTALFFLHPSRQAHFTFKRAGTKDRDGVRYWVIRGDETGRPTLVTTNMGRDAEMYVEYLVDPESGRVARTTMRMKYPAETDVSVEYRPDEKLGMWVPSKMDESYDMPSSKIRCAATYSNFRRFQVNTDTSFRDDRTAR
jgi:hypothetical protein